jgi:hypothetical protein
MPPAIPNYDLGLLITLNISLTIVGILAAAVGLITMSLMLGRQLREIHATGERIASMTREVAFMIRRQYVDIDRDLQEIKELLGGQ